MPVEYQEGIAGGEIHHDQAALIVQCTAQPTVGYVGNATVFIDDNIVKETAPAIGHAIQANAPDRSVRLKIQHQHLLRTCQCLDFAGDKAHVQHPQPTVLTIDIETSGFAPMQHLRLALPGREGPTIRGLR